MPLEITNREHVKLIITNKIRIPTLCISLTDFQQVGEPNIDMIITKDHAIQIIDHLEKQFNL